MSAHITVSLPITLQADLPGTLFGPTKRAAATGTLEAGQVIRIERNHSVPVGAGENEIVIDAVGARWSVRRTHLNAALPADYPQVGKKN